MASDFAGDTVDVTVDGASEGGTMDGAPEDATMDGATMDGASDSAVPECVLELELGEGECCVCDRSFEDAV